ncbi:uncharacterized protein CIMG_04754 [Coccidioides immitis RS]|uniref:Uncharacterized protein n=1 Tax=Coccidioides immitis (strain RS) TaxID=246410 RepID=J3KE59_COCIM|nr:uncharacterized protein CIMG_04754 [Coccidioides immitis RS]EAS33730.3 hypothetical protein CIMG_04754 [Coccidioides immitis RS]
MDNKTTIGISINEKERAKAPRRSPSITSSISSAETSNTQAPSTFNPSRSLFINSQGVRLIRLPVASYELEVNILNPDGSFGDLLKTCYFFGPHRDPVIRSASNDNTLDTDTNTDTAVKASTPEIKVVGKWNSRTQYFTTFYGDSFQWRYIQCDDPHWNCKKLLVLESLENNSPDRIGRRVAQLVRNEHTRPQGASKSAAGNGGELLLDDRAIGVEVDEALVVATCLLMLKKEIDRRRMAEIAVFGIAAAC